MANSTQSKIDWGMDLKALYNKVQQGKALIQVDEVFPFHEDTLDECLNNIGLNHTSDLHYMRRSLLDILIDYSSSHEPNCGQSVDKRQMDVSGNITACLELLKVIDVLREFHVHATLPNLIDEIKAA